MGLHEIKRFYTTKEVTTRTKRQVQNGQILPTIHQVRVLNLEYSFQKLRKLSISLQNKSSNQYCINELIREFLKEKHYGQYILLKVSKVSGPSGKWKLNYSFLILFWSEWLSSRKQRTTRKDAKKRKLCSLWGECKLVLPLRTSVWKYVGKLKTELPTTTVHPPQRHLHIHCLFTTARNQNHHKCPSTDE